MVWATSALPRNGHLPGVGGGREAMADNAHGVDVHKNRELRFDKKGGEREVTRNFGKSPPPIVICGEGQTCAPAATGIRHSVSLAVKQPKIPRV